MPKDVILPYEDLDNHYTAIQNLIARTTQKWTDKLNKPRLFQYQDRTILQEFIAVNNEVLLLLNHLFYDHRKELELQRKMSLDIIDKLAQKLGTQEESDNG